jgi:ABC-type phosphate transport system substrate-binding protein
MDIKRSMLAAAMLCYSAAHAADLVVIANPALGPMTKEQVADLFLGKSQSFTPYDQDSKSPIYADFYQKAAGRTPAQVKATWSRVVFSGMGQTPRQVPDSEAVKKAVAGDPKGVGYIEKSAVDATVKAVLSLD